MRKLILAASILGLGCLISTNANAQGQLVATCGWFVGQIIKDYGMAAVEELAKRYGKDHADYVYDKFKPGRTPLTEDDIRQIEKELGISLCELRQALEKLARDKTYSSIPTYSAEAHCSRTGVVGRTDRMPSPQQARRGAIFDCYNRGGVWDCCVQGAYVWRNSSGAP
jgi:hypothetical protein